jgi:hypothetical protein
VGCREKEKVESREKKIGHDRLANRWAGRGLLHVILLHTGFNTITRVFVWLTAIVQGAAFTCSLLTELCRHVTEVDSIISSLSLT